MTNKIYHVLVPHLEIEEYHVAAESVGGAIAIWRNARHALIPDRTFTPIPGPSVRAELAEED